MRFMIIRKADAETEAEIMPSTELIEAMTSYNEKLSAAGVLVGGDGLLASSAAPGSSSRAASRPSPMVPSPRPRN